MPIQLDSITRKKLILVRQFYEEAKLRSELTYNNVYMIMAIVGFDLAIETVLKAVFSALNSSTIPSYEFQPLVTKTENEMKQANIGQLQDKAHIQHIHNIRNDVQHKAKYPTETEVSDCRTYARDFLEQIIKQVWDVEFDKISLVKAIHDAEAKEFLLKAEESIKNTDYKTALENIVIAFEGSLLRVSSVIIGRESISLSAKGLVIEDAFGSTKTDGDLLGMIKRIRETLLTLALGINHYGYLRYKRLTMHMIVLNKQVIWTSEPKTILKEEIEFAFTFATNSIAQVENIVGDLTKPFGSQAWFYY